MQRSPGTFTAGTVYGQIGTNQIVGAVTSWMVAEGGGSQVSNIAPFDWFAIDGQAWIAIKSIEDDQHLTLWSPLPFGIPAGTHYTIVKAAVSPSNATQGLLQKLLALGTSASPLTYEAFDNGVAAFQWGFADDGRARLQVGATGADGSPQHPWHAALLIDPATGNVTATGLANGSGGAGNQFWYITGKPPGTIGVDGDVNFDFVNGFVVYRKAAGSWSSGLDILAVLSAAVESYVGAAQAAAALAQGWASTADGVDVPGAPEGSRSARHYADVAAAAATLAAGWSSTPDDTDVPGAAPGARSARHYADKAAAVLAGAVRSDQAQALTAAQKAQAVSNLGLGPMLADGQVRLVFTDQNTLTLLPFGGGQLVVNGQPVQVPAGGITLAPSGSAAPNYYFVYAQLVNGMLALLASGTAPAADSAGRQVMSGDPAKRFVGMYILDGNGKFRDDVNGRWTLSYFNRQNKTGCWTFDSTTTSVSPTAADSGHLFLCFGDEPVWISASCEAIKVGSDSIRPYMRVAVQVDGNEPVQETGTTQVPVQYEGAFAAANSRSGLYGSGTHILNVNISTSQSSGRFVGSSQVTVRG